MVLKEEFSFSADDLPTPVLVYSKKNGTVVCWNKPARKLLGYESHDRPSVDEWRLAHKSRPQSKKNTGSCVDLGVIPHITKKGDERLFRVVEKSSTYGGEPCFINWITDVTEYIQTETAYANFYGAVTNASIVSMADRKGIITYVNQKFEKISGYNRKELIGQNHRIINSGYHPRKFWIDMWKTISSGKTWRAEVMNKAKDRSYYWVDTFVMPFLNEKGRVEKYLSIRNDITDRKSHEDEITGLVRQLSEFNYAITSASIVSRADKKGVITYINDNFIKISGYKAEELIGQNHRIINSAYHPKSFWVTMWKTIASGKTWRAEVKNKKKDGSYYWVDTFVMPFLDEHGKVKEFLSIRNDITQRKSQEEQIISLNHSLADFQNAITKSSIVSRANKKGIITYVNKNFIDISGYSEEELVGQNHNIINSGYHPRTFWTGMWKAIAAGRIWRGEVKNKAKDGSYYWVDTFIMPFLDEHGRVREFLSIRNNITPEKETREDLRKTNESLSDTLVFGKMGSAELDLGTRMLTMSRELLQLLEAPSDKPEVIELDLFLKTYVDPKYLEVIAQKISEGMKETGQHRNVVETEFELITTNGRSICIEAKGIFKGTKAYGILHDITERNERQRAAEEERRAAEIVREELLSQVVTKNQQIENILFSVTDYFFSIDRNFNFTLVNPSFARYSKMRVQDMVGKNAFELLPYLKDSPLIQRYKVAMERQKHDSFEYESILNRGQFFRVNAYPNSEGLFVYFQDVSNEKVADLAIRKSQMELNAILNASRESTYYLDRDGCIQIFNRTAANNILKSSGKKLKVGMNILEVTHASAVDGFKANFKKALAGEFVDVEREINYGDTSMWVHAEYLPIIDGLGKVAGVSLTINDITDRKQAEVEIQQSNERFKKLYNQTPAMMHSMDEEGNLTRVSDFWLQKMEYTRDEVLGRRSVDFLTEESRKKAIEEVLPKFYSEGTLTNVEYDWVTKSGKILNTLLSANSEYDENGKFIKSMAVITDITEKKKLEKEIEKLAMIAKYTSNAVILCDAKGRITWVNEGFMRLTEYSLEEVLGKKPGTFLQGPETNPATVQFMSRCIEDGIGFKEEILNLSKSGKKYWLDIEVMPIRDKQNVLTGFMAIESDITQLKLAISEMLNSQSRLEAMMNNAPMVVFMKDLQNRYIFTNDAFADSINLVKVKSGYSDFDLFPKPIAENFAKQDRTVIDNGKPVSYEHVLNDKTYYTVKFPITDFAGKINSIGGMSIDITESKKAEREILKISWLYEFTSHINQMVIHANTKEEILHQACQIATTHGKFKMAWMGIIDSQDAVIRPVVAGGVEDGYLRTIKAISVHDVPSGRGPTGRAYRERKTIVNNDLSNIQDENFSIWRNEALKRGYHSSIGIPIVVNDEVIAIFTLYSEELNFFGENELKLLKEVTDNISYGITAMATENDRREKNKALIETVDQLKKAERTTRESELRLRTILETEPECVKILNKEGELMEMNKAGLEMIGASSLEQVKGQKLAALVHEPYRQEFTRLTKRVFEGSSGILEFEMTGFQGTTRWLETHAVPMYDAESKITSLLGVTRDITLRKEAERRLRESEERYRKLFELNPAPTWTYDISTLKFLHVNKAAVDHYGYSLDEFKQMTVLDIRPDDEKARLKKAIAEVQTIEHDDSSNFPKLWKHVRKDGSIIHVEVMTTALDQHNLTPRLVTINDVTEKIKANNKLENMVHEKEMLIREIHHRVKNNLQLISSILYIRLSKMPKNEMKDFLNEMRQRIKSIAFLHERLLQTGSINRLEIADYLQKLIADIKLSTDNSEFKLTINADVETISLDLDSAIYCGLIMNELITNSIKYAFNGMSEGVIDISLKKKDDKIEFLVADNGSGIPLPVEFSDANSTFGMQLLDTFRKQLKADLIIDNSQGTKFKFTF